MDSETHKTHISRLTLNIEDVAILLGINRSTAYELARRNEFPVPIIRLGKRMVVSRRAVEELLGQNLPNGSVSADGDAA